MCVSVFLTLIPLETEDLSSLGEEVVTQAMALGRSGFSSLHGATF